MSTYRACLVPDTSVAILILQLIGNWLASALPVADAVPFEFDGINVTAHAACDDTDSASDAPARLLRPVHQRLSW